MLFDFDKFTERATQAYESCGWSTYTLDNVLAVFWYYFAVYEGKFQKPHPMISREQIERIIYKMPYEAGTECPNIHGFAFDDYPKIIRRHFATKYRNCDYNINHFFSGKIRDLRYYEICK